MNPAIVAYVDRLVADWAAHIKEWERADWYYFPSYHYAQPVKITPQWLARERSALADTQRWLAAHQVMQPRLMA